jgi:hypothetical protein
MIRNGGMRSLGKLYGSKQPSIKLPEDVQSIFRHVSACLLVVGYPLWEFGELYLECLECLLGCLHDIYCGSYYFLVEQVSRPSRATAAHSDRNDIPARSRLRECSQPCTFEIR